MAACDALSGFEPQFSLRPNGASLPPCRSQPLVPPTIVTSSQAKETRLERPWGFWQHLFHSKPKYKQGAKPQAPVDHTSLRILVSSANDEVVDNVELLLRYFNNMPNAEKLNSCNMRRLTDDGRPRKKVEGVSVFEAGVSPDWEHESNQDGLTVTFRSRWPMQSEIIDLMWERLVINLIGECLPLSTRVKGVKLIVRANIARYEVWLSSPSAPDVCWEDKEEGITLNGHVRLVATWFRSHISQLHQDSETSKHKTRRARCWLPDDDVEDRDGPFDVFVQEHQ
ncbi:Eukaryotic initiation factor 4E domain protein [Mollivirus kamchatka]|nr:Eukaryotic initiation factor 4E domain protein [Mollivirus kamchatka]